MITQAEQANEHDEKQRDVSDEHSDEGGFAGLGFKRYTAATLRYPIRAKLRLGSDKSGLSKIIEIMIHPHGTWHQTKSVYEFKSTTRRRKIDLPWIRNPRLAPHTTRDVTTANFFLFQIAMLATAFDPGRPPYEGMWMKTYMRRTINNEAAAVDRKERLCEMGGNVVSIPQVSTLLENPDAL